MKKREFIFLMAFLTCLSCQNQMGNEETQSGGNTNSDIPLYVKIWDGKDVLIDTIVENPELYNKGAILYCNHQGTGSVRARREDGGFNLKFPIIPSSDLGSNNDLNLMTTEFSLFDIFKNFLSPLTLAREIEDGYVYASIEYADRDATVSSSNSSLAWLPKDPDWFMDEILLDTDGDMSNVYNLWETTTTYSVEGTSKNSFITFRLCQRIEIPN